MKDTTREIFEKHEIRKTKEQKAAFRDYLTSIAESEGYKVKTEQAGRKAQNVIVGDPRSAKVVYTAHYDTCPVMPFPNFITPKCIPIYIIYQVIMSLVLYIIPISVMISSRILYDATGSRPLFLSLLSIGYVLLIAVLLLILFGPANKHTANDNTSGVTLLIDLMKSMPSEERGKVAYIFFDLEERGTVGSKLYAKKHSFAKKDMLLINFDCVSDGKHILFVAKKRAEVLTDKLTAAFTPEGDYTVEVASKGVFYPSDQRNFELGVGVSALNKTRRGLLYMNKIHTKRDTVYDEENIDFLRRGAIELVKII